MININPKNIFFSLALGLIAAVCLALPPAYAATSGCSNGYCANASSPVVGGYATYKSSSIGQVGGYAPARQGTNCVLTAVGSWSTYAAICAAYAPGFGAVIPPASPGGKPSCPVNTAPIYLPRGYVASNGTLYNKVTVPRVGTFAGGTTVCVKSDTYTQYGG